LTVLIPEMYIVPAALLTFHSRFCLNNNHSRSNFWSMWNYVIAD